MMTLLQFSFSYTSVMLTIAQFAKLCLLVTSIIPSSTVDIYEARATSAQIQTTNRGIHNGYYYQHTLALSGFLGLILIKITALVVVLVTLITGGLFIKLFGIGLIFGATRYPYYSQTYPSSPYTNNNQNEYRAAVQPSMDIISTIFSLMETNSDNCKAALVCLINQEAAESPLFYSAFKFITDNLWKVELDHQQYEDCAEVYLKCNN